MSIESNPRQGGPGIPEFPTIRPDERTTKNSPRHVVFDFDFCGRGSNSFAADPSVGPDCRRGCEGERQNQGSDDGEF